MKKSILFLTLLVSQVFFAQVEDAWVIFADKENVQQSINNPLTILTQEAIDRKTLHNIPIDERDVPVNENYITQLKNQTGISVLAKSKWMNCAFVRGSQAQIEALLDLPFVLDIEYADKSLNFVPGLSPVEDKFAIENNSKNFEYGAAANQIEMLSGDFIHFEGFTGTGMRIAILDSGFEGVDTQQGFSYIRDDGRILGVYDFVNRVEDYGTHSHGTRVLSTMGGFLENNFAGTAPDASYYLFITEDVSSETPVEEAYWVEALERADSLGVHVVNTSLGYREYDNPAYSHTYQDLDGQTTFGARGANHGFDKGLLLVTSAGNSGNGSFPWVGTPGDSPGMLTIGAVDEDENAAGFSSQGPTVDGRIKPDLVAQGAPAYVINQDNEIVANSGTSFSAPITAGLVACLWQARPEYKNFELMQLLRESAHLFNNPTDKMGYGIPNFQTAMEVPLYVNTFDSNQFRVHPNPAENFITLNFPETITESKFSLFSSSGNLLFETTLTKSNNRIPVAYLSAGLYVIKLQSASQIQTLKVLKK